MLFFKDALLFSSQPPKQSTSSNRLSAESSATHLSTLTLAQRCDTLPVGEPRRARSRASIMASKDFKDDSQKGANLTVEWKKEQKTRFNLVDSERDRTNRRTNGEKSIHPNKETKTCALLFPLRCALRYIPVRSKRGR